MSGKFCVGHRRKEKEGERKSLVFVFLFFSPGTRRGIWNEVITKNLKGNNKNLDALRPDFSFLEYQIVFFPCVRGDVARREGFHIYISFKGREEGGGIKDLNIEDSG